MSVNVSVNWTSPSEQTYEITASVTLDDREGFDDVDVTEIHNLGCSDEDWRVDRLMFFKRSDVEAAWEGIRNRLVERAMDRRDEWADARADRWLDERMED